MKKILFLLFLPSLAIQAGELANHFKDKYELIFEMPEQKDRGCKVHDAFLELQKEINRWLENREGYTMDYADKYLYNSIYENIYIYSYPSWI